MNFMMSISARKTIFSPIAQPIGKVIESMLQIQIDVNNVHYYIRVQKVEIIERCFTDISGRII